MKINQPNGPFAADGSEHCSAVQCNIACAATHAEDDALARQRARSAAGGNCPEMPVPEWNFCAASLLGMAHYRHEAQAIPPRWALRPVHQMRRFMWRVRRLGGLWRLAGKVAASKKRLAPWPPGRH
eukprot:5190844-Pyramimonas_sp.AAC.1